MPRPILDKDGIRQPRKGQTQAEVDARKTKKAGGANGGSGVLPAEEN